MDPPTFVQTSRRGIRVLGRRASIGDIHEGYSVEFRQGRCDYALLGWGITRAELRRFAEGLQPRARAADTD